MNDIFRIHIISKTLILDHDAKFNYKIWKLNFITTYHAKNDGKIKRTNKMLEYMLTMYVIHNPTKWEYYLYLVEFYYNNEYPTSSKMSPFEVMYRRI